MFASPAVLLQEIGAHGYTPDIAIVDIQMDEMSGIELAKRINTVLPQCAIIFATSYLSFATDVYETEHAYFILKVNLTGALRPPCKKRYRKDCPRFCIILYPMAFVTHPVHRCCAWNAFSAGQSSLSLTARRIGRR